MKNINTSQAENNIGGISMPHSQEVEKNVIGVILSGTDKLDDIIAMIPSADYFYNPIMSTIYGAILSVHGKKQGVDLMMVCMELMSTGKLEFCGGMYEITELSGKSFGFSNILNHCSVIVEKYVARKIVQYSQSLLKEALSTQNPLELALLAEKQLNELQSIGSSKDLIHISKVVNEVEEQAVNAKLNGDTEIIGVPTGFRTIQEKTNGWQSPDLVIVAARPSIGKSALAFNFAINAAEQGKSVALFNLEMSSNQVVKRLISNYTNTIMDMVKYPSRMTDDSMEQMISKSKYLKEFPIYLDETFDTSLPQLANKCRRLKKDKGLDLIIVDYLQLMNSGRKGLNREQEVATIARGLKGLAKELNVPVIALSQLSRSVEQRAGDKGKIPQLSDLRESGAIEQDADMVLFLHRPDRMGIDNDENGDSMKDVAFLICAKHRSGELFEVKLKSELQYQRFVEEEISFDFTEQDKQDLAYNPYAGMRSQAQSFDFSSFEENQPF